MSAYFISDVHLRLDRPDRARRLTRFVAGLKPDDTLTIVGDLCDFWFSARQRDSEPMPCEGLDALTAFRRRGGDLAILLGNHDGWLGPFYERAVGATILREPLALEVHGLRLLLVHGHRLGARPIWKGWMESRTFLEAFGRSPGRWRGASTACSTARTPGGSTTMPAVTWPSSGNSSGASPETPSIWSSWDTSTRSSTTWSRASGSSCSATGSSSPAT